MGLVTRKMDRPRHGECGSATASANRSQQMSSRSCFAAVGSAGPASRRAEDCCACCACCACLRDLAASSSVPGLAHLRPDTPWLRRALWGGALVSLVALWVWLAVNRLHRWQRAPVVVTMAPAPGLLTALPLPAVTICAATANVHVTATAQDREQIEKDLSLLCMGAKNVNISKNLLDNIEKFAVRNFSEDLISGGFLPDVTIAAETGVCEVHNSLPGDALYGERTMQRRRGYLRMRGARSSWSPDAGYAPSPPGAQPYPLRARGPGFGLRRLYSLRFARLGSFCADARRALQARVHSPAEASWSVAGAAAEWLPLRPGFVHSLSLTPRLLTAPAALRAAYSPRQRRCLFADERPLALFGLYSQAHCHLECLANASLRRCGCLPFHAPRLVGTPICNSYTSSCISEAQEEMNQDGVLERCGCLSSCTELSYSVAFTKEPLDSFLGESMHDRALVLLTFPQRYFVAYERTEVFSAGDFIANVGGLLGLCLGVSLVSVAELLFWLARLLCTCRCRRPHRVNVVPTWRAKRTAAFALPREMEIYGYSDKAVVRVTDMTDAMQQDAVDCAAHALGLFDVEMDCAAYIKKEFDKKYERSWHCVVGTDFGTMITHETRTFIYFYIGQIGILLYRSG